MGQLYHVSRTLSIRHPRPLYQKRITVIRTAIRFSLSSRGLSPCHRCGAEEWGQGVRLPAPTRRRISDFIYELGKTLDPNEYEQREEYFRQ